MSKTPLQNDSKNSIQVMYCKSPTCFRSLDSDSHSNFFSPYNNMGSCYADPSIHALIDEVYRYKPKTINHKQNLIDKVHEIDAKVPTTFHDHKHGDTNTHRVDQHTKYTEKRQIQSTKQSTQQNASQNSNHQKNTSHKATSIVLWIVILI